jgi:1-aminocyclopropane-1-carboxylate deaminase/D-cysteine desulfhydrase-like pyridoxal-dependent ACC family enzyme
VVDGLRDSGARPYVIPAGGSTVIGAAGELLAGLELAGQMPPEAPADLVVLPSATGGTQAGLIVGLALAGWSTRVLGVAVAHPSPDLRPGVEQLSAELAAQSAVEPEQLAPIEIDDRWLGRGYGEPSEAAEEATTLLARTEGVFVDPIYTAKALAALIALVQSGEVDGQRVVFWHAGGTPALFEEHAG